MRGHRGRSDVRGNQASAPWRSISASEKTSGLRVRPTGSSMSEMKARHKEHEIFSKPLRLTVDSMPKSNRQRSVKRENGDDASSSRGADMPPPPPLLQQNVKARGWRLRVAPRSSGEPA